MSDNHNTKKYDTDLAKALRCVDADSAYHWPTVADILAVEVRRLEAELAGLREDRELVDWLESQKRGYGRGWVTRESETGRGFRIHESSRVGATDTLREAIDKATK